MNYSKTPVVLLQLHQMATLFVEEQPTGRYLVIKV